MTSDGVTRPRALPARLMPPRERVHRLTLLGLAVYLAYAAGAYLSTTWFEAATSPTFFPAAGVTLGTLVLTRRRDWTVVLAAAGAAEATVDLAHGWSVPLTIGFVAANTAEPAVGALLLRRAVPAIDLGRRHGVLAFLALPVLVAPLVGALIGIATITAVGDGADPGEFILHWWLGDGLGILVVGGVLLAWAPAVRQVRPPQRIAEGTVLVGAVLASGALALLFEDLRWGYVPVVVMPWIAFRLGVRGVTLAGAGFAFIAAQSVAMGTAMWTPFDVAPSTGLAYLQLLIGMVIATTMVLAGEIGGREDALRGRAGAEQALERARKEAALASALNAAASADDVAEAVLNHSAAVAGSAGGALVLRVTGRPDTLRVRMMGEFPTDVAAARPDASLSDPTAVGACIRSGDPVWCDLAELDRRFPASAQAVRDLGGRALSAVPLRDRGGRIMGALSFLYADERTFRDSERLLVTSLADRAAAALERVRLADADRRARRRAERLEHLAAGLAGAATVGEIAAIAAEGIAGVLDAAYGVCGTFDDADRLVLHGGAIAPGDGEPVVPAPGSALEQLIRRGGTATARDGGVADLLGPAAVGDARTGVLTVVRDSRGGRIGLVGSAWPEGDGYGPDDAGLLELLAELVGQALERARLFERERRIAIDLQTSLLPGPLTAVPGASLGVRYRAGEEGLRAGGDWYEAVALDDGRLGIAIGDVVGRGLRAAAAMGQLRSALAALAPHSTGPADLLDRLDHFANRIPDARLATVCYAEFDPTDGTLRYACAGHPPPLVVGPGGAHRFLEDGRSTPLGIADVERRAEAVAQIPPGAAVLLYTDGLVERRREPLDEGFARLAATATGAAGLAPEALCAHLVETLAAGDAGDDDAAVICLRRDAAPGG